MTSRALVERRKSRSGWPPRRTGEASAWAESVGRPSALTSESSGVRLKLAGSGVLSAEGAGRSGDGPDGALDTATGPYWQPRSGVRLGLRPEEVGMLAEDQVTEVTEDTAELSDEDVDELLVEEVSIDGMCGVY
jgi:mycofactocin precursor